MNTLIKSLALIFSLSLIFSGCAKKQKRLSGDYISLMEEISYAKPDETLKNTVITIPAATINPAWPTSNFSLNGIPENIKTTNPIDFKTSTHSILGTKNLHTASISPVIVENVMYLFNNKGHVSAFQTDKLNKPLWTKIIAESDSERDLAGGGLVASGNRLIVTFGNKTVVALNKNDGQELWRLDLSNIARSAPIVKDNKVFVLTIDNRLYCLSLIDGKVLWTHEGAIEQFGIFGFASPAVFDNLIITPHSSGQLFALNTNTGEPVWNANLIKSSNNNTMLYLNDIDMTPIIKNGVVYISNYAGVMFSINAKTGEVIWANDAAGGNKFAWIAGDYIYSVNRYNQLTAMQKKTGQFAWVTNLEQSKPKKGIKMQYSGPTMINGSLYVTCSNGMLMVYNPANGEQISEHKISNSVYSPIIAVENQIYFISNSGSLSVVR